MVETTVHREGSGAWVSQATIPCPYVSLSTYQWMPNRAPHMKMNFNLEVYMFYFESNVI